MVCPAKSAYDLHMAWPESRLFWIPDAGHSVEVRGLDFLLLSVSGPSIRY